MILWRPAFRFISWNIFEKEEQISSLRMESLSCLPLSIASIANDVPYNYLLISSSQTQLACDVFPTTGLDFHLITKIGWRTTQDQRLLGSVR